MITDPNSTHPHEDRIRALEECLLALVADLRQLRKDMAEDASKPADHDDTSSS